MDLAHPGAGSFLTRDGEPLVIEGIALNNKIENDVTKKPLTVEIPFIGDLFKNTDNGEEGRESLVHISPRILDASGAGIGADSD